MVVRHATNPSRYLSLLLRHKPEVAGIGLSENGWANVDAVVGAVRRKIGPFTRQDLRELVAQNDKQRFELSPNGKFIRAVQGHSLPVDLGLKSTTPPEILYHGTKTKYLDSIMSKGLVPGTRNYVHLNATPDTAKSVARRGPGSAVLLRVKTLRSREEFYLASNGVWLARAVEPECVEVERYLEERSK